MNKKMANLLIPASLLFLAACGGNNEQEPNLPAVDPGETETGATVEPGNNNVTFVDGGTLVWVTQSSPVSLDPTGQNDSASTDARSQIFESLVRFNPHVEHIELEPALATSWGNVDPYTWFFNIREGVTFHDGAELDAHAVVRSLQRAVADVASPSHFVINMITDIVAVDDMTVHITTEFPFAPLPGHLTHSIGGIISPLAIEREEEAIARGEGVGSGYYNFIQERPVGTGPFAFYSEEPGNSLTLSRVENHWRQTPYIEFLHFWAVPEASTRFATLETGESNAGNIPPTDFMPAASAGLGIIENATTTIDYVGFNTTPGHVLEDHRIRQAIMHATNRHEIIEFLAEGFGLWSDGFLSPMVEFSPLDVPSLGYDMARAEELLLEVGISPENPLTLQFWFNEGNTFREQVGLFMQASLAPIGINLQVQVQPWDAYLEHTGQGLHDLFMLGWVTVTGDADYGLLPIFHSDQHGDQGNRFFFSNAEVDAALEEGRMSSDPAVRAAAYRRATEIINYYVPAIPIRFQQSLFAYNGIVGLSIDFSNTPSFELARIIAQ